MEGRLLRQRQTRSGYLTLPIYRRKKHPPLIVYKEDKRMYFECLQKYDEGEELNPLYGFFKYETEETWERALTLVEGMKLERKGLSDFIQG